MAKPKLALIPAAQGSKLFSVLPSSGVGDFDFTRSGSATRINSQGLIETVGNGQSRLNYPMIDGKVVGCPHHILEPQRTNLFTYSEAFDNAYWSISRIETPYIANVVSPDGTLNAYTLEMSSGETNAGGVFKSLSVTGDNSISVFAKKKSANYLVLSDTGTTTNAVYFDLENGTVGTTYNATGEIQYFGNGWYRCTMKYTLTSSGFKFIYLSNVDGITTNGVQGGDSIYIYGAQLEIGSYPTSYIPTNGGSVTRSAETCNGAGDAATFNDSEGVLMAEISGLVDADDYRMISLNAGNSSNTLFVGLRNDTGNAYFFLISGGSAQATYISDVNATNTNVKLAVKYKENDVSFYVNGFELYTDNAATMISGLNRLEFNYGNQSFPFYGNTKQLQYFDTALNDTDLEELTSWTSFNEMAESQLYSVY